MNERRARPARPAGTRRGPLRLETLEGRILLAGNLLADLQVPGQGAYNLREYTPQGALVSSHPVPAAPSGELEARGLSVGPDGNVNIYDGTFTPALATYTPATDSFAFQTFPGWSTVNNISYGEVAAYGHFVFASDMFTFGGEPNGIVRFDSAGGGTVRFASGNDFIQVALGQDGLLYGLLGTTLKAYDPDTLAPARTVTLQGGPDSDVRSVAVDSSGQILAATWSGYLAKYDASGHYLASIQLPGQFGFGENLINVALDTDGQVAVGGRFGEIYLTNEALAPAQTIQTNQWVAFVTFDHYIGTGAVATPTFESLVGPTIPYGQPAVTLGGRITAVIGIPSGSVDVTLAGVSQPAAINPADGTFSATFDTGALAVSGSPYVITYSYPGDAHDNPVQDTSHSLTVTPAVTSFSGLASPTVVVGTSAVELSGVVGSPWVVPAGQSVTVSVVNRNGRTVAAGQGVTGTDGAFSAALDLPHLQVGTYTILYSYAGDANFTRSSGTAELTVTYDVEPLFDTSVTYHAGDPLPITLWVSDAAGYAVPDLLVRAVSLVNAQGGSLSLHHGGGQDEFSETGYTYLYNLDTSRLGPGTYTLLVRVANDPLLHAITFTIA
jgi:hypothetical protein